MDVWPYRIGRRRTRGATTSAPALPMKSAAAGPRKLGPALLGATALAAVSGCGGTELDSTEADVRALAVAEATPSAPLTAAERAELRAAFGVLSRVGRDAATDPKSAIATETLARIRAGDVRLGSVARAVGVDRWHMCKDFDLAACQGAPTTDPGWRGDEEVATRLADELDGYMWGNRLYFSFRGTLSPEELAATLVHEVNHVLNRSECSYYRDLDQHEVDDTLAWVEEYRAFLAECFFRQPDETPLETCSERAAQDLLERDYGFEPDLPAITPDGSDDPYSVGEAVFDERSHGHLVAYAHAWPPSFGVCSTR